jgi:hypothetical protein
MAVELDLYEGQLIPSLLRRTATIAQRRGHEHPVHFLPEGTASLWSLLELSCQRRATVRSDHVFAVMGLMKPETQSRILVDYSRSDASTFTNAFEIAINHEDGRLRLPCCWEDLAFTPSTTPELPSWCPDLGNESQLKIRLGPWTELSDRLATIYDKFAYMRVCPSEKSLHLRVMKADVVAQVVDIPSPLTAFSPDTAGVTQSRLAWEINFAGTLGTWLLHMHSTFGISDGQEDVPMFEQGLNALLWKYLSGVYGIFGEADIAAYLPKCSSVPHDCIYRRRLTNPRWCFGRILTYIRLVKCHRGRTFHLQRRRPGACYDEDCSICNPSRSSNILFVANRDGVHLDRLSIDLGGSKCRSLQPFEEEQLLTGLLNIVGSLEYQLPGMYIFKTAAGRYGHSSRCPSVGDHVCVVPGGQLLHIISANESRYVGVASVDGLMDDDILEQDLFPDPEGRFEEVVLY